MRIPIKVYENFLPNVSVRHATAVYPVKGYHFENIGGQLYLVSVIGEKDG